MATVKIDRFGGMLPRTDPSLLPDGMAVEAKNCRLKSGKLVPIHQPSILDNGASTVYFENGLSKISDAHSIYCWKHTLADGTVRVDFLAFPGRVYFAHGNIADDKYDRVFVTGETGVGFQPLGGAYVENSPCVYLFDRSRNSIIRHTICKDALQAPRCMLKGDLDTEKAVTDSYFIVSWFDEFGYESESSLPSLNRNGEETAWNDEPLSYNESSALVTFSPMMIPTEAHGVRVYKTMAGNEAGVGIIQFVKEFGRTELHDLSFNFDVKVDDNLLGETMPNIQNPPTDILDMSFVPGNYYVARSKSMPHTVLFSDVDMPTSWPIAYRYDIRDNIVKLAVTANTVFALTDGFPYILSGTAPESMTATSIAGPAACVSERAVCVLNNAVYFVSNYGLYTIYNNADAGTVCKCVTEQMFTKEQWSLLNPSSAIMGQFDNALHVFFTLRDGTHKAFIVDLTEDASAILTTHDEIANCICVDDRSDEMYFVRMEGEE